MCIDIMQEKICQIYKADIEVSCMYSTQKKQLFPVKSHLCPFPHVYGEILIITKKLE